MSTSLFEIKSAEAGRLLEKFGLSHKSNNGTYKKGKCTVIKDKSFVKVIYPSGSSYTVNYK